MELHKIGKVCIRRETDNAILEIDLNTEIGKKEFKAFTNNLDVREDTHLISNFIDQIEYDLIGHQAYYADGSNKFYDDIKDIEEGVVSNPLINVQQVGKLKK